MSFKTGRWKLVSIVGGAALAVILAAVWLLAGTSVANASEVTAADVQFVAQSTTGPGLLGEGYLGHGGWGRGGVFGGDINYQELLANALGISVDDLQTAYENARTTAIEQAVEQGLITQEQADEMLVWGGFGGRELGGRGLGFFRFRRAPRDVAGSTIDEEALLADALNISVDDLQAAREQANQAAIAKAVEEGIITQEQADEMQARKNLQSYLNRDALLAKALGMSVDDLKAAYADGETLSTLMNQQGLDAATVRENLQTAYDEALAQAVTDGVITQAQADELQDRPGFGFSMPFGPGEFGGRMGPRGGFGRQHPQAPDTDDDTGIRFHRSGQGIEADGAI
jgi:formaldehyde-activating enzyme involved in methanogenesis